MNDRQYSRHCAQVERVVRRWKPRLWLGMWTIHVEHNRNGLDQRNIPSGVIMHARTVSDWRYEEATIECDCPSVARLKPEKLDSLILHELIHTALDEMREWRHGVDVGLPHEERVTTHLKNMLGYAWRQRAPVKRARKKKRS